MGDRIDGRLVADERDEVLVPPLARVVLAKSEGEGGSEAHRAQCVSVGNREANAVELVKHTQLITLAESLGGPKSLVCVPSKMTHASVPREARIAAGINDSLVRVSIGLEHPDDLVADLEQALAKVNERVTEQIPA